MVSGCVDNRGVFFLWAPGARALACRQEVCPHVQLPQVTGLPPQVAAFGAAPVQAWVVK